LTKWLYAEQVETHYNDHTADIILTMSIPSTQLSKAKIQRANFFPVERYDSETLGDTNDPRHTQRLIAALKRSKTVGKREARSKEGGDGKKYRVVEGLFALGGASACITLPVMVRKGEDGGYVVQYLETLMTIMDPGKTYGNPYYLQY
jgi:hypothetical protein